MKEKIIITLTTWSKRIGNIPTVLDTIYDQTTPPDLVVLNLAYNEIIPKRVQDYIKQHGIEVNRVPDTKVYKKLIPTLKKYPEDCVISIDDDWLYPPGMIADFMDIHQLYSDFPISGNNVAMFGLQCHCGCASLTKAEYFGRHLNSVDDDIIAVCPSDDIVYTYFASLAGHPYIRTKELYFRNMQPFDQTEGYSEGYQVTLESISRSYSYLTKRFGTVPSPCKFYLESPYWSTLFSEIITQSIDIAEKTSVKQTEDRIYATHAFRVGQIILRPLSWLKYNISNKLTTTSKNNRQHT